MHAQGLIVETDPDWVSPYGSQKDSNRRAFYSAVVTLTLGVLGRCDCACVLASGGLISACHWHLLFPLSHLVIHPCMTCLRSTILPVPYAFSKIGILVGSLTMLLVASVNDATCCMLIRYVPRSTAGSVALQFIWRCRHGLEVIPSGMDCGGIVSEHDAGVMQGVCGHRTLFL